jgi:general secretion pathway protein N
MSLHYLTHWRAIAAASLLASALAVPGSTAAVSTDAPDLDAAPQRRTDTPATPSLWDRPAAPAPIVVKAAAGPAKPAEPERAKSGNPLWAIPLATLTTTRDRPIFSPSRRPPPAAVVPAPVAVAPPPRPKPVKVERPQLALVGTIAGPEQSFGIFVDQTTKAALRLRIGEEYHGWRLRAVASREVTLERDEQTTVLTLPPPDANAAQRVTIQAENTDAISEPRRLRGNRR